MGQSICTPSGLRARGFFSIVENRCTACAIHIGVHGNGVNRATERFSPPPRH